ncbi:MAG: hypothetical protein JO316_03850 [Abitibacteriaceae bacterium]|nr:hypothetical protein [Abditibacteriaceae bacterium]
MFSNLRTLAIWFLVIEGVGSLIWWSALILTPASRAAFMFPGTSDATLLAFMGADLILFTGASLLSAYGLQQKRKWAWPVLCLHTGAAVYATLYCLALSLLSGGGWIGTIMMAPCLVVLPYLTWNLYPKDR